MTVVWSAADAGWMDAALALARRQLGAVWPNPAVGAILVKDGRVLARGVTQSGGRPHAERVALDRAGAEAVGATLYVTLEPCNHHGVTPPCTDALLEAKVARVVVATEDPDPRVNGSGIARLRAHGVQVDVGLRREQADEVNAGFFCRICQGRPLVTLKLATSLDGRIAAPGGVSKWITGPAALARAHLSRARHDAVLVGAQTALADDPELTCRLPGLSHRSPVRVVADGRLRLPLTHKLVQSARNARTWLITRADAPAERLQAFATAGLEIITATPAVEGGVEPAAALAALGQRGITRLMVEGGGQLAASLVAADLVDRIEWYRAPILLGGDGAAAVAGLDVASPAAAPRFVRTGIEHRGDDVVESYRRRG
ncbi:MAG: bifunctional diaminohydroxyphosphoribosylaminopyrimidine deaminase/5-amino-6-(5-phosphoribosylamino)uracil reductase RibD [Alphaproteobacteria bacterium]|nr:bifunctional diaminohydroxyphosphoribosylaminopyrimidine deaminase/5-amino-6-(5-phosphoribosylamino)uracil reductase RibD [Alphaproteobacteria bacterium]